MKLYDLSIEHCPELNGHPEFVAQRPIMMGIAAAAVYRFEGTNVYSWYIANHSGHWERYGELIVLKPREVKKFKESK